MYGRVEFRHELFVRHAGAPLFLRFEQDGGLEHVEAGRVGRGLGPARFAEYALDFRKRPDDPISLLEQLLRLRDRNAGHGGRHVEQVAFPQGRHELGTEARKRDDGDGDEQRNRQKHGFRPFDGEIDDWMVHVDEKPIYRVPFFGQDPAPDEIPHEDGHHGDGEDGGRCH